MKCSVGNRADGTGPLQHLVPLLVASTHRHGRLQQLQLFVPRPLVGQRRHANQRRQRQRPMLRVIVRLGQLDQPRGNRRVRPIAQRANADRMPLGDPGRRSPLRRSSRRPARRRVPAWAAGPSGRPALSRSIAASKGSARFSGSSIRPQANITHFSAASRSAPFSALSTPGTMPAISSLPAN